jgi:zinc transport system substrate-binding protein
LYTKLTKGYIDMNKRQKIFVTGVIIVVLASAVVAAHYSLLQGDTESNKIKVVTTFYPLTFFTQQIGGEEVIVKQLIPDNMEAHSWQPSISDIAAVDEADILFYNGASLDHWFEDDILPAIDSSNKIIVETTEGLQLLEGQPEPGEEHEEPYDPHTWISPSLAKQQAQKIYEALTQKDPTHKDYYSGRWQTLAARFEIMDNNYMSELSSKTKEDIFVAHAAIGYLAERYGFKQHGVIGISADEQPSASTYINIVNLMIEYETYVIYVDPVYPDEYAQTLKNDLETLTGQHVQILNLYLTLGPLDGLDYFGQQEKNLENLKIGLGA